MSQRSLSPALAIGAILGGLNGSAIGLGMAVQTTHWLSSLVMVAVIMFVPGACFGVVLGWLASALEDRPVIERRVVILGLPLLAVGLGFWMIGLAEFALVSCLPTAAAAHYLELRTRASASVPVALASKQG